MSCPACEARRLGQGGDEAELRRRVREYEVRMAQFELVSDCLELALDGITEISAALETMNQGSGPAPKHPLGMAYAKLTTAIQDIETNLIVVHEMKGPSE